jgi:co-chaperonin GroES (HSP10)
VLRPIRDRIRVTRLEGHGIESVSPGGIIMPATREKSVRTKADYFRARVEAIGPEARYATVEKRVAKDEVVDVPELRPGDEVFVYTYSGDGESTFTGTSADEYGLFVRPEDILCVVEGE